MKAIGLYRYLPIEESESLIDVNIDKPAPTGQDLLVKINAVSVNPLDIKMRAPRNKVEKRPRILGWDAAGVVELTGPDCTLFSPGDEVYYAGSITRPGCNSEYHLVDERIVGKKPTSLDFAQSVALPLTGITAWEGLFHRLGINMDKNGNSNKSIFIIGSAGGVGSVATQLAKFAGLTVIGTASRSESAYWTKEHGADFTIDHSRPFAQQLKEVCGLTEVNYMFCLNGIGNYWEQMADIIAPQGKICSIVESDDPLDFTLIKNKSVSFVWESMFTRSTYETEDMIEQYKLLGHLAELVDAGKVKSTVTERLSPINAANLRLAHQKIETGKMIGKVVLENFTE